MRLISCDKYTIILGRVTGSTHIRNNLDCQDNIDAQIITHTSPNFAILTLADGHGSKRYFRSDIGSRFAIDCALFSFLEIFKNKKFQEASQGLIRDMLPREILRCWNSRINKNVEQSPFNSDPLFCELSETDKKKILENPQKAYGTTLITIFLTERRIIYLQIGDGDILTIYEDEKIRHPLPRQNEMFGNETASLCLNNAEFYFDVKVVDISSEPCPLMIMATTDGYSNSFNTYQDFEQSAIDILNILKTKGSDFVKNSMKDWLWETSKRGSGDDIAMGLIVKRDLLK